jgi:hypothetical protein
MKRRRLGLALAPLLLAFIASICACPNGSVPIPIDTSGLSIDGTHLGDHLSLLERLPWSKVPSSSSDISLWYLNSPDALKLKVFENTVLAIESRACNGLDLDGRSVLPPFGDENAIRSSMLRLGHRVPGRLEETALTSEASSKHVWRYLYGAGCIELEWRKSSTSPSYFISKTSLMSFRILHSEALR